MYAMDACCALDLFRTAPRFWRQSTNTWKKVDSIYVTVFLWFKAIAPAFFVRSCVMCGWSELSSASWATEDALALDIESKVAISKGLISKVAIYRNLNAYRTL